MVAVAMPIVEAGENGWTDKISISQIKAIVRLLPELGNYRFDFDQNRANSSP
jgi:hypothetical protein